MKSLPVIFQAGYKICSSGGERLSWVAPLPDRKYDDTYDKYRADDDT